MLTVTPNIIQVETTDSGVNAIVTPNPIAVVVDKGNVTYNISSPATQITAAENLGGHRVVTVEGYYASKDTASDKFKVLGITTGAVSIGATATVTTYGTVTESSWNWTVGSPVFLSTNGQLTQTAPTSGFRTIIGVPLTTTSMFIDISEPLILV